MARKPVLPDISYNILDYFDKLPDPRLDHNKQHKLTDVVFIALCAIICGCNNWAETERYGNKKIAWFRKKLKLANGIPSHDTFGRVFSIIDPDHFSACLAGWMKSLQRTTRGKLVAIDGKTARCSHDRKNGKSPLHMVSAWVQENSLVLGQIAVDSKTNEIKAIPELLDLIDIEGRIVSIDAMGCQRKIASKIAEKQADYVFSLKGNQSTMHNEVALFLNDAKANDFRDVPHDSFTTVEKDHGRIEKREYRITSDIDWFADKADWKNLKSFGMVTAHRTIGETTTVETRFFITSLPAEAKLFAEAVRGHWSVENQLHWTLDVVFREDDSRIRKDNGPANFAILLRLALTLCKQEKTAKIGVHGKRLSAGWDNDYLELLLGGI